MSLRDAALPGECHPAIEWCRDAVLGAGRHWKRGAGWVQENRVRVAVPQPVSVFDYENPVTAPTGHILEFERWRVAQSFFPRLGAWVWDVWVDQHGRMIAARVEDCRWQADPLGETVYGPFNPV